MTNAINLAKHAPSSKKEAVERLDNYLKSGADKNAKLFIQELLQEKTSHFRRRDLSEKEIIHLALQNDRADIIQKTWSLFATTMTLFEALLRNEWSDLALLYVKGSHYQPCGSDINLAQTLRQYDVTTAIMNHRNCTQRHKDDWTAIQGSIYFM